MGVIYSDGLDLAFEHTKEENNIPTKRTRKSKYHYLYDVDPMFRQFAKNLEVIDYKQHLTRFRWNGLPNGLDSEMMERIMYYRFSGAFFRIDELDRYFFLPYSMSGEDNPTGVDCYGRFNRIKPYSFNGTTKANGKKKSAMDIYLSTQIRNNVTEIPMVSSYEEALKYARESAVICFDHSPGMDYGGEARVEAVKPYIEYLIKIMIQTKSALINSSGFNLFSTSTETAQDIMQKQIDSINACREKGQLSAVVSSSLGDITNIQSNATNAMIDYFLAYTSIDNLRMQSLGINNDGVTQKTQYQNIASQQMDFNSSNQIYIDSYMERVKFCAICNAIWGLDMYVEPLLLNLNDPEANKGDVVEEEGEGHEQAQGGTNED